MLKPIGSNPESDSGLDRTPASPPPSRPVPPPPTSTSSARTSNAAAAPPSPPVWKPDAAMMGALDDEMPIGSYRIRPPRGYRLMQSSRPGKEIEYIWHGPVRKDGTHPFLVVGVTALPAAAAAGYTPDRIFEPFLNAVRGQRENWGVTPVVVGLIEKIPFALARWTGTEPATGQRVHGFLNVGCFVDGDQAKIVVITSQDSDPYHDESLKVTGASALSFRRAPINPATL